MTPETLSRIRTRISLHCELPYEDALDLLDAYDLVVRDLEALIMRTANDVEPDRDDR
jgi:hypothetical protein